MGAGSDLLSLAPPRTLGYLGSKLEHSGFIAGSILALVGSGGRVVEPFAGSAILSHRMADLGLYVMASDVMTYSYHMAVAAVECSLERHGDAVARVFREAQDEIGAMDLDGVMAQIHRGGWGDVADYLTGKHAGHEYATRKNAASIVFHVMKAEDIRESLPRSYSLAMASIINGVSRVLNTMGHTSTAFTEIMPQARRHFMPRLAPTRMRGGPGGEAKILDALDAARQPADVAYLDPPWSPNMTYAGYYWLFELLCRGPKATRAMILDEYDGRFDSPRRAASALAELVGNTAAPIMIMSYSPEGIVSRDQLEGALQARYEHFALMPFRKRRYAAAACAGKGAGGGEQRRAGDVSEYIAVACESRSDMMRARAAFGMLGQQLDLISA